MTQKQEEQQSRMIQKEEDQWARMAEQVNTTIREVLPQMSQADLVRLLPWFLSIVASSSAGPKCSVSEALAAIMQPRADAPMEDTTPEFEGTTALVSISSPTHWASTLSTLVLPMLDIPVRHLFFMLAIGPKHKKWDHSPRTTPEGQSRKRAYAGTEEASISSRHSTPLIQPGTSHSPDQPEPKLSDLPSSQIKAVTNSNDGMAAEPLMSTIETPPWRSAVMMLTRVVMSQILTKIYGECCWHWSQVCSWELPHMFRYCQGGCHICPQEVLEESMGLLQDF